MIENTSVDNKMSLTESPEILMVLALFIFEKTSIAIVHRLRVNIRTQCSHFDILQKSQNLAQITVCRF